MNVPKLRFKEFNDEWNYNSLSNYVERIITKNKNNESNLVLTISAQYGLVDQVKFFNRKVSSSNISGYYLLNNGDFAYNKSYSNGYPWGAIKRLNNYNQGVVSSLYICFRPKNNIDSDYLEQYFETNKWYRQVSEISVEGARNHGLLNIAVNDFFETKHYIPSIMEQAKIGQTLQLLDKKIELQTKKIETLKLFKKGLFDTQLKINGKESIMFDDFLDEVTEKSSIQNQYPVLSSTSKGLFLQSDYFNKQASSENNVGYKILKRNQLVLSPQNLWMGNININNIFDIGIVSPSYRVYNIDIKKIDLNYFNYWIKTPKALYNYLISSEQGASIVRRNLNIEMFNQISLKIPNLEKQHIIGNMIYQFDLKINLEEEKLKLLYKLKKGLMQKMFI